MNFKLVIAIVLVVILIAGGVVQELWLEKTLHDFEQKILSITPNEDGSYEIKEVNTLYKWWKKQHYAFEFFLPHTLLYNVDSNFGELVGAVDAGDDDTAQALLSRLLYDCKVLAAAADLRAGNII